MAYRSPIIVEPVTLTGSTVVLEPLSIDHAEGLSKVADSAYFALWPSFQPPSTDEAGMRDLIRQFDVTANVASFAICLAGSGEPIGMSSYLDIRAAHLGVEIGATWIAREYQGTKVNPEAKLLMLAHAFEVLGCQRVQLKTDMRNVQSQAAIRKLGATEEGVLRQHMQMHDGYMRDTVMFSVIASEWPIVKAGLMLRLAT